MPFEVPPLSILLAEIFVLFFGIGLHEYAHCKFADMAGDPTPAYYGRVTLNLFKHFEPTGTFFIIFTLLTGFGIGWGRPAPMNASKMRNPRWDLFASVAAGPISNLLQAVIYAFFLRIALSTGFYDSQLRGGVVGNILLFGVLTNLGLFLFNLIPFGPLDGHWLLGLLMPEKPRHYWFRFNRQVGMIGLIAVILYLNWAHISVFQGPISACFRLLTGQDVDDFFQPA